MARQGKDSPDEEDRKLSALERSLREILSAGEWPVDDLLEGREEVEEELPPERRHRIAAAVRNRCERRQRLRQICAQLAKEPLPFGRLIATLRERATISLLDAARQAHLSTDQLRGIEEGTVSPFELPPASMADIAETFWIPVSLIASSVKCIAKVTSAGQVLSRGHGRDVAGAKKAAVEDMQAFFAKRRAVRENSAAAYIESVREALKKRGATALL